MMLFDHGMLISRYDRQILVSIQ